MASLIRRGARQSAICFLLPLLVMYLPDCRAQQAPTETVLIAPKVIQIVPGEKAPFPISFSPLQPVPLPKLLILLKGLPEAGALSAGRPFDSGTWALVAHDLPGLFIEVGPQTRGESTLSLSVITLEGQLLAVQTTKLVVQATLSSEPPRGQAAASVPAPSETSGNQIEPAPMLMARGDVNLATGQIHVARLFYRRAAESGWAPGAIAMAQTYDPHELGKLKVRGGVQPSMELAREWYEKARLLGADVSDQLRRLGGS